MTIQQERYPLRDDDDAEARFNEYKSRDPFPDIPAALLNSADIYDYVRTTGMIYPFDSEKLKPASYEASVGKTCIRWDEKGNKQKIDLRQEGSFVLAPNSIAFVTTREQFRLPDYMAVRFNLRITNVHRGLLLGTGPLVDPGFEGHLLIPLHNLTTNKYIFRYEEDLIWLEFTKISLNENWTTTLDSRGSRQGQYVLFRKDKKNLTHDDYLQEPEIRSSIPDALREAKETAKRSHRVSIGTVLAVIALGVTLWLGIRSIWVDVRSITGNMTREQATTTERVRGLQEKIDKLNEHIESLETKIFALEETPEQSVAPKREDPKQADVETNKKIE